MTNFLITSSFNKNKIQNKTDETCCNNSENINEIFMRFNEIINEII